VNFLAHCALGADTDQLIVGGFLGDFVKGPVSDAFPADIAAGIRLHRRLDAFSATEPGLQTSCRRLPATLRRFAPPFVDLLADHLLAQSFAAHHGEALERFGARAYDAIDAHRAWLPARAARFFDYMRGHDLFLQYRALDAVEIAFTRVMARLDRTEVVAPMMAAARSQYDALARDFERYYPALQAHAVAWLEQGAMRDATAGNPLAGAASSR
jgi:acyl carrier protein phosphodiesterase